MKTKLLLLALCSVITLSAQTPTAVTTQEAPTDVMGVFDELITSSGNYNDNARGKRYKVVDRTKIAVFKKSLKDSVSGLKSQIITLDEVIANQNSEITGLKSTLTSTNTTLESTRSEKDSMSLLGIPMSKTSYNSLVWGIAALLLAALLFFITRFKSSNSVTKDALKKLEEAESEFEDYRKKALEKEQKMGRLLQDERNKLAKSSKA